MKFKLKTNQPFITKEQLTVYLHRAFSQEIPMHQLNPVQKHRKKFKQHPVNLKAIQTTDASNEWLAVIELFNLTITQTYMFGHLHQKYNQDFLKRLIKNLNTSDQIPKKHIQKFSYYLKQQFRKDINHGSRN